MAGAQVPAVEGDALAHPDQAVPARLDTPAGCPPGWALVGDLELGLAVAVGRRHARADRACVFERVGQRLLDDSVDREVGARRQRRRLALRDELDLQPAAARLLYESGEIVHPGLRRQR